jgi:hypothetical protein
MFLRKKYPFFGDVGQGHEQFVWHLAPVNIENKERQKGNLHNIQG